MRLTDSTYFSREYNELYFSTSQFKSFLACEASAMAELKGNYERPTTKSLLIGSYVDAHFAGTLDTFKEETPEIFNRRTGELKADFKMAESLIERAERDDLFKMYMSGEPQKIMTGMLFDEPFKIKMDSYHEHKAIVDLKTMRSMDPVYKDGEWKSFVDAWGYDLQGYIYQQVVKFNTGEELPFYLAVVTKEEHPDIAIIHIPQWKLNSAGAVIEHYLPRFAAVKRGEEAPIRCEKCGYCRDTKRLTGAVEYDDLMKTDL